MSATNRTIINSTSPATTTPASAATDNTTIYLIIAVGGGILLLGIIVISWLLLRNKKLRESTPKAISGRTYNPNFAADMVPNSPTNTSTPFYTISRKPSTRQTRSTPSPTTPTSFTSRSQILPVAQIPTQYDANVITMEFPAPVAAGGGGVWGQADSAMQGQTYSQNISRTPKFESPLSPVHRSPSSRTGPMASNIQDFGYQRKMPTHLGPIGAQSLENIAPKYAPLEMPPLPSKLSLMNEDTIYQQEGSGVTVAQPNDGEFFETFSETSDHATANTASSFGRGIYFGDTHETAQSSVYNKPYPANSDSMNQSVRSLNRNYNPYPPQNPDVINEPTKSLNRNPPLQHLGGISAQGIPDPVRQPGQPPSSEGKNPVLKRVSLDSYLNRRSDDVTSRGISVYGSLFDSEGTPSEISELPSAPPLVDSSLSSSNDNSPLKRQNTILSYYGFGTLQSSGRHSIQTRTDFGTLRSEAETNSTRTNASGRQRSRSNVTAAAFMKWMVQSTESVNSISNNSEMPSRQSEIVSTMNSDGWGSSGDGGSNGAYSANKPVRN